MPKQTIEIEVDVPEGWYVIDIGHAKQHDYYIEYGTVRQWTPAHISGCVYAIVEPAEAWRPATVDDVIQSLQGEPVKARFRDSETETYYYETLCGYQRPDKKKNCLAYWIGSQSRYLLCEVLSKEAASE